MNDQILSIEQMQELIDMGIDVSKTSLYWSVNVSNSRGRKEDLMPPFLTFHQICQVVGHESFKYVPTFTLQDVLEMLPHEIKWTDTYSSDNWVKWFLNIEKVSDGWVINYANIEDTEYSTKSTSLLEAVFNMLKWVKQNNYI